MPYSPRITSLEELHTEMRRVKQRINDREDGLGKRWRQVPGEAVKGVVEAVLPLFLGNELASGAWRLVKGAVELIKGKNPGDKAGGSWKDNLAGGAKKLGLFTAVKLLFNLWKGK